MGELGALLNTGVFLVLLGMFLRIENRLTKVETVNRIILRNLSRRRADDGESNGTANHGL